jgi:Asp-tRNA(Asn)/Glu-tRNA(Gln) amidotransferase A subunit family amidase
VRSLSLPIALLLTLSVAPARGAQAQDSPVFEATINELQEAMASGSVTAVQLVDAFMARIAAYDHQGPRLNAMMRLNPMARAQAEQLDRERAFNGPRGPLHGIPIILKDNYDTFDMPTTGASIALAGLVPPDDAFQVKRLREAGAVILGKANMHELAMGITTISSLGGQTLNPYDPTRNPGGSSGGTGAAIAASFAVVGWGSDTCGSIRIPSSQNNLFGLRPTKGLSSIDGIIPLSHTQDTGGPLARTATDLAIALDATVGWDPADPATAALADQALPRFVEALDVDALRGARLGLITAGFGSQPEDREMGRVVRAALEEMKELGAEIVDSVTIPNLDSVMAGSGVINFEFKFDFVDYLNATPGAPVGSIREILDRGLHHTALERAFRRRDSVETRESDEYRAAYAKRDTVRTAFEGILDQHRLDALVYPTMRRKPAHIGDPQRGSSCSWSANSGLPALSVPAGFTTDGLPVGIELLGTAFSDARLVAMAYAFEQATDHRQAPGTTPPLVDGSGPDPIMAYVTATGPGAEARADFIFDVTTGVVSYDVTVSGVRPDEIHSVNIHATKEGEVGPVLYRLSGTGITGAEGEITLTPLQHRELTGNPPYLVVYTKEHPTGAARGRVVLGRVDR